VIHKCEEPAHHLIIPLHLNSRLIVIADLFLVHDLFVLITAPTTPIARYPVIPSSFLTCNSCYKHLLCLCVVELEAEFRTLAVFYVFVTFEPPHPFLASS